MVVEVEKELKGRLHATLALDGLTVKEWFVEQASDYVERRSALSPRPMSQRATSGRGRRKDGEFLRKKTGRKGVRHGAQ
jgi:hypothetical protein